MPEPESRDRPIRVGVIGVGRGRSFARGATDAVGMKLVALCDTWKEKLEQVGREYGVSHLHRLRPFSRT